MRTLFLVLLPLLLIALAFPAKAFDEDLLLYLSFDESAAADETGKTKDATIQGGVELVEGRFGEALELDGASGYLEIELTPELIATENDSLTAELWLKTQQEPNTNYSIFGGYGPEGHFGGCWNLFLEGEKVFGFEFDLWDAAIRVRIGVQEPEINDGEWHHVAGVRDREAGVIRIYIDGELVGEENDPTENLNNGREFIWLGNTFNRFWPVIFDEVRVWSRPLNDTEILKAMDGTIIAVDPLEKLATTWGSIK